jgi:SET domain-containing protein
VAHKKKKIEKNVYGQRGSHIVWGPIKGKGRGVFTTRRIKKGEIVEVAPVLPISKKNVPEDEVPDGWVLDWDDEVKGQEYALALGYIMVYNHSTKPNIELESDLGEQLITAVAVRNIAAGEELTWDYGCEVWFETVE